MSQSLTENNIVISIDKASIAVLPLETFAGKITVVDTPEKVAAAVDVLMREKVVGFDTETRPSFKKGKVNHVALMQFSTSGHCFLFRVNKIGITPELRSFIENPDIIKVGLSLKDDFSVMHRSDDFSPSSFIDLQHYVNQFHIADLGLQRIYAILFGRRISKHQRLTNWEAEELSEGQQIYAAIDAWACLRIYRYLRSGKFIPSESPYIRQPESGDGENCNVEI